MSLTGRYNVGSFLLTEYNNADQHEQVTIAYERKAIVMFSTKVSILLEYR